jgi:hypothetical protein
MTSEEYDAFCYYFRWEDPKWMDEVRQTGVPDVQFNVHRWADPETDEGVSAQSRIVSSTHVSGLAATMQPDKLLTAKAYFRDAPGSREREWVVGLATLKGLQVDLPYEEKLDSVIPDIVDHLQRDTLPKEIKLSLIAGNHTTAAMLRLVKAKEVANELVPQNLLYRRAHLYFQSRMPPVVAQTLSTLENDIVEKNMYKQTSTLLLAKQIRKIWIEMGRPKVSMGRPAALYNQPGAIILCMRWFEGSMDVLYVLASKCKITRSGSSFRISCAAATEQAVLPAPVGAHSTVTPQ